MKGARGRRGGRGAAGLAAVLAVLAAAPEEARAVAQSFDTALPVAQGSFVLRAQFLYIDESDDPSPADRELSVVGGAAVLGYGVTHRLAAFGSLPVLYKRLESKTPDGRRIRRSTSGVGDMRLWGRYTVLQRDAPGRTFRVAPFAGLEVPSGRDDDRDGRGRLPQPLQVGSGSWDPFFGVVATYQTLDLQIDGQVAYEHNREANQFEFGDELRADASFQYRLWPRALGPGVPGFVYGGIELNVSHRRKNEIDGDRDPNSGGTSLFVSPTLQYVTRRWVLETIVQIPALQELNGTALEADLTVRSGFRVNF